MSNNLYVVNSLESEILSGELTSQSDENLVKSLKQMLK